MTEQSKYKCSERTVKAILMAGLDTWPITTYRAVSKVANVSPATVKYHFESPQRLRSAIANFAVDQNCNRVLRYLIASNHSAVADMDDLERANCFS